MKMKTLLASGLCFALTVPASAREENPEVDSIYITPFTGARIILVGKGMEKLLKENNLEVLKNKFVEDYRESAKDKDFPATAKHILYFAGADGRRRLKAVPDEAAPVDVQEEIKALNSNLPPFHYTIYDLTKDYQYHIYVPSPEVLDELAKVNLSQAQLGATTRITPVKRYTVLSLAPTDTGFTINKRANGKRDLLSIFGSLNGMYVNNHFSPGIELNADVIWTSRYGKPIYKVGGTFAANFFADTRNDNTTVLYNINNTSLHFLKNFGSRQKEQWLGLSYGRFSTFAEPDSSKNNNLYRARKLGIISQFNNWGLEYNLIFGKNDKVTAGITLRYYF